MDHAQLILFMPLIGIQGSGQLQLVKQSELHLSGSLKPQWPGRACLATASPMEPGQQPAGAMITPNKHQ